MASSQNSGGSSRSRSEGRIVMCYHYEPAPLRTMRFNGPTTGRRFYGCPHWPNDPCGFISWADQVDNTRHLQTKIQKLMTKNAELEMKSEVLMQKYKKLEESFERQEEQLEEAWMENASIRDGLYSAKADKKLMIALIVSWALFAAVLLTRV